MDPRWLELLKASGWQLFGLSLALSIFWLLIFFAYLPPIELPIIIYGLPLAILVLFFLAAVSAAEKFSSLVARFWETKQGEKRRTEAYQKEKERFEKYVPYLTDIEWRILAYLFQNDQKVFTASVDGDLASTLYNQGYVKMAVKPGQQASIMSCTFAVSDPVWDVIASSPASFSEPKVELGYRNKRPWHSGF